MSINLLVEPQVVIPQLRIELDRDKLLLYGLTAVEVNEFIETAMNGARKSGLSCTARPGLWEPKRSRKRSVRCSGTKTSSRIKSLLPEAASPSTCQLSSIA